MNLKLIQQKIKRYNLYEGLSNTNNTNNNVGLASNYIDYLNTNNTMIKSYHLNKSLSIIKHCPPSTKEWNNSIFTYDKNTNYKLLPVKDNILYNLLNAYLNLNPLQNNVNLDDNKLHKSKVHLVNKLSTRNSKSLTMTRLFISKPEIKQNNNKIVITVYVYNRKRLYFVHKLKKIITILSQGKPAFNYKFKGLSPKYVGQGQSPKKKTLTLETLKVMKVKLKKKKNILNILKNKSLCVILLYLKKTFNTSNINYLVNYLYRLPINKSRAILLRKISMYKYYCSMLYFNSYIFNANNLLPLKTILTNIYKKKIELNIVNLKYLYLDSNIFAEAITRKLKDRKKRVLRVLKLGLKLTKQPYFKIHLHKEMTKLHLLFLDKKLNIQFLENGITTNKYLIHKPYAYKLRLLLYHMKQKIITGIKLQGTGRLTKRLTASRSISKVKYMGSLKNINSSYESISTVMLRGYVKSNLQYININDYNRNGSFGTKVSISVY